MQFYTLSLLVGAASLLSPVAAQTWTNCNPLNSTCPNDSALGLNHNFVFNTSTTVSQSFNVTAGAITYGTNGAEFTVAKRGDSPTIQSQFYIFFGSVSVIMKAATGQGIISSIVLESDDLDEVDWEFMGGNGTHAETNYFGKGNTTSFDRAIYYPVSSDPRENFHNYTVDWTSERIQWWIDSQLVRTLPYAAANGGNNFPQTPMTVRLGIWAGGDPGLPKGTIEWAGGLTDFSKGPYTMYVQSAQINDYTTGSSYYQYSDHTGSWQSIKSISGNSTTAKILLAPPPMSMSQKFTALPQTTKLAIYGGGGVAAALLISAFLFTFIRQRRAGRRERDAYNAKIEKEREDAYRDQMELREKGLGGWDKDAFAKQGDDALGGWGGTHIAPQDREQVGRGPTIPPTAMINNEYPSGMDSISRSPTSQSGQGIQRFNSPGPASGPGPIRMQSPLLASPTPQSPRNWSGGNQGGMIHNAGNAYSGAYGGSMNIPRSPGGFPGSPVGGAPQQARGYPGGYAKGGYQRF